MANMSHVQKQMPAMLALAHERSEGSRVELAGMLADIFIGPDMQLSLRENELLNELIEQLLQARTSSVRAHLVERFADAAHMSRMPRAMAKGLAADNNIEIARRVLTTCESLVDEDLISIIVSHDSDHAKAIAQRSAISEAVADALVTTGDVTVMQMVAENLGAKLSVKAIEVMTDAARFAEGLREPLLKRPEMTADAATRLYWWVSQELRRYALKRFGISSGQIDQALAKTIDQMLDYHDLDKADDKTMIQVADWLNERQAVSIRILPQVLRLGHFRLFNILLSRLANLSLSLIDAIVTETGGRGLAVVCRAIGIDKAGFVSIFLLSRGARPGEQIVHPRELSYALAAFDRLSVGLAQDLLHNWKQDPSYFVNKKQQDDVVLEG
jgi:uncharacterized protein (DUF2336 family)